MNTFDCKAGFSLMTARPAAPTCPRPIPAPNAAKPNARPAPRIFNESELAAAPSSAANATLVDPEIVITVAAKSNNTIVFMYEEAPPSPYLNHDE